MLSVPQVFWKHGGITKNPKFSSSSWKVLKLKKKKKNWRLLSELFKILSIIQLFFSVIFVIVVIVVMNMLGKKSKLILPWSDYCFILIILGKPVMQNIECIREWWQFCGFLSPAWMRECKTGQSYIYAMHIF